jgi:hypothetical protein
LDSQQGIKRDQFVRAVRAVAGIQVLVRHAIIPQCCFRHEVPIAFSFRSVCNMLQLRPDLLDVVWGIFDEDGDGRLTKAEFMDVSTRGKMRVLPALFLMRGAGARGARLARCKQEEPRERY